MCIRDSSGGTAPYEFILLDGDQQPTGIAGGTGNLSIAWEGLPNGAYCVEVVDANGCGDIFCDTLGVSAIENTVSKQFSLVPNPASGVVRLDLPQTWEVWSILIRDATGREVDAPAATATASSLDVGRLAPGTYLVEVRHSLGVAIERLVVRR